MLCSLQDERKLRGQPLPRGTRKGGQLQLARRPLLAARPSACLVRPRRLCAHTSMAWQRPRFVLGGEGRGALVSEGSCLPPALSCRYRVLTVKRDHAGRKRSLGTSEGAVMSSPQRKREQLRDGKMLVPRDVGSQGRNPGPLSRTRTQQRLSLQHPTKCPSDASRQDGMTQTLGTVKWPADLTHTAAQVTEHTRLHLHALAPQGTSPAQNATENQGRRRGGPGERKRHRSS